jgi:hypothetical protein
LRCCLRYSTVQASLAGRLRWRNSERHFCLRNRNCCSTGNGHRPGGRRGRGVSTLLRCCLLCWFAAVLQLYMEAPGVCAPPAPPLGPPPSNMRPGPDCWWAPVSTIPLSLPMSSSCSAAAPTLRAVLPPAAGAHLAVDADVEDTPAGVDPQAAEAANLGPAAANNQVSGGLPARRPARTALHVPPLSIPAACGPPAGWNSLEHHCCSKGRSRQGHRRQWGRDGGQRAGTPQAAGAPSHLRRSSYPALGERGLRRGLGLHKKLPAGRGRMGAECRVAPGGTRMQRSRPHAGVLDIPPSLRAVRGYGRVAECRSMPHAF